jgi:LPXTG-motif cell wall-anchored protein
MSPAAEPAGSAPAGGVTLGARADHLQVTVGDPIAVTFTLHHPEGMTLAEFDADHALKDLEVLGQMTTAPKRLADGTVEEGRVVTVAAYKTGAMEIPAVRAVLRDAAGKEIEARSAPLPYTVASVLRAGESEPADLKRPVDMRERLLWPWFLLGGLLLAVAAIVWWRRRRKRPEAPVAAIPAAPPRPEHEIAYEELERLLSSGLIERGEMKAFYIALAEIIRRYLGRRFGFDTFESTTWEILDSMRGARLPAATTTLLAELLGLCDLVKFAKHLPGREETKGSVERAYRLVDETKRTAPPALPGAAGEGTGAGPGAGVAPAPPGRLTSRGVA